MTDRINSNAHRRDFGIRGVHPDLGAIFPAYNPDWQYEETMEVTII
jgi:hypothetical protein